jgi:tetratricopeptide (TPR) repeat protein
MKTKILFCLMLLIWGNCSLVVVGQNDYWFQKGQKANDPVKKIKYFTKSIEKEDSDTSAYDYRAKAKFDLQDYQGAIADFDKAIEQNALYATAYK